ncbi:disease resistance protein At4g27190-like isoform X2 [Fagus crenata]
MNAFKVLFRTVEYIQIESCEMECIVDTTSRGDHTVMFANLIKLHLMYMSCLRTICEGPNHYVIFSNLTDFVADGCTRLVSLFSPSVAQSLKKLKNLRLVHCNELKQIISEDEGMILESHSQPICLPELQTIYVKYCPKLEYIFPLLVARDLPQLESLELEDLPQLKQVFDHEKEGDVRDGNNASVWPSLKEVKVENCPKMKWSFFADLEANVPAHGKVPQVDEEDESIGFSTNPSVVILWPPNKDEGDADNDDLEWDDADLMGRRVPYRYWKWMRDRRDQRRKDEDDHVAYNDDSDSEDADYNLLEWCDNDSDSIWDWDWYSDSDWDSEWDCDSDSDSDDDDDDQPKE